MRRELRKRTERLPPPYPHIILQTTRNMRLLTKITTTVKDLLYEIGDQKTDAEISPPTPPYELQTTRNIRLLTNRTTMVKDLLYAIGGKKTNAD